MIQAVSIAEKIAPYRHARLSAVKLAGDPNSPVRFKDDATADELREGLSDRSAPGPPRSRNWFCAGEHPQLA
jgi:hypothetical protein